MKQIFSLFLQSNQSTLPISPLISLRSLNPLPFRQNSFFKKYTYNTNHFPTSLKKPRIIIHPIYIYIYVSRGAQVTTWIVIKVSIIQKKNTNTYAHSDRRHTHAHTERKRHKSSAGAGWGGRRRRREKGIGLPRDIERGHKSQIKTCQTGRPRN